LKKNNITTEIKNLEKKILNPHKGLPEEIFLLISRITPLINVDLLIKDKKLGVLLTWRRKGETYPAGWHVPGGIIRLNEKTKDRIIKVAREELDAKILFSKKSIAINEIHLKQKNRKHCISLLYLCKLKSKLKNKNKFSGYKPVEGQWKWFKKPPKNIIAPHNIYRKYF